MLLYEQPVVIVLLEKALISWSLTMDERGGHQDLCDSSHKSVASYVHKRMELYCSRLVLPV
jgi:hypothetical protein